MSDEPISYNPFKWLRSFLQWVHAAFCALMTEAGLKAWALLMAWGCGVAMAAMATYGMWSVRDHAWLIFWLATQAMFINLVVITGIMVLLGVRRNLTGKHGDTEIGITDAGGDGTQK